MKATDLSSPVEGATPLDDISGLKLSWVNTQRQLDGVEAENIRLAQNLYLGKKRSPMPQWFTKKHIDLIHKAMFGKVWSWAGKYRKTEKSVGVQAYKIPFEMAMLENDIRFWCEGSFTPIEISARVHHRLVWIHPYENGNGRHARFIGDMVLKSLDERIVLWPSLNDHGQERQLYIQALKEADHGDFAPLILLLSNHQR